jgi:hypothetical protein
MRGREEEAVKRGGLHISSQELYDYQRAHFTCGYRAGRIDGICQGALATLSCGLLILIAHALGWIW